MVMGSWLTNPWRIWSDWRPDDRPVVYRVMMPALTQAGMALIPDMLEKAAALRLAESLQQPVINYIFPRQSPDLQPDTIVKTFVRTFLVAAFLIGFIAMLYRLAAAVFPDSTIYALLTPVLALFIISACAANYSYTYDAPELFFMTAGLYLLLKQRWAPYLCVLTLATLNKDTTVFLIIFYGFWCFGKLRPQLFFRLLVVQLCIYCLIKGGLHFYFADRPGEEAFMGFFWRNVWYVYAYNLYNVTAVLSGVFLLIYRWSEKPAFLRCGMWVVAANSLAYVLFCNPGEFRDFYSSMPLLALMLAHSLIRASGVEKSPLFSNRDKMPA